ncbi:MAG: hypothetical protein M0R41_17875 [Methylobacter tundripaludum]|jgi:hypothetical protein|nr:hypothetical protein [Methylobacter tundripaludum]
MKDSYKRLCFLIASAGFREEELSDFVAALKESAPSEFANDVSSARRIILASSRKSHGDAVAKDRKVGSPAETLEEKVVQLLVIDAGLSRGAAADALLNSIRNKYPDIFLPNFGKMGFGEWIRKIAQRLSPSEILHFASIIRDQHVHDINNDWRLK